MRLTFFDFNINYGGAPQGSVYLAKRLAENHEVHIIDAYGACREYCDAVTESQLPLHILSKETKNTYIGSKSLKRFCRVVKQLPDFIRLHNKLVRKIIEINPDVIWVNNEKSLMFLACSPRLRKFTLAVYIRSWATPDQINWLFGKALKYRVNVIIAHAKATIEQLKQRNIPEIKLFYTPNTIDFLKVEEQANETLSGPDLTLSPKILLPAARPVPEKGHITAVKAIAIIKNKGFNPVLWLPGKVATGVKDDYLQKLKETVTQLGIEDNVKFIGWQKNMPAIIKTSDVVILPTHTEGFPRVILEAMFLKTPVCSTSVGGIPEAIKHKETGMICEIDNEEDLAQNIITVLENTKLKSTMIENAYKLVKKEYCPEKNTLAIEEAFGKFVRFRKRE